MSTAPADALERVKAGLAAVVGQTVEAVPRREWNLLPGGEPTVLPGPLTPHLGFRDSRGYMSVVASGAGYADVPGVHNMRRDEQAPPGSRFKRYGHFVVEDLVGHALWPDVLRAAGLEATPELEATVRAHVFSYPEDPEDRDDHHSPSVPEDIARARPRDDTP